MMHMVQFSLNEGISNYFAQIEELCFMSCCLTSFYQNDPWRVMSNSSVNDIISMRRLSHTIFLRFLFLFIIPSLRVKSIVLLILL